MLPFNRYGWLKPGLPSPGCHLRPNGGELTGYFYQLERLSLRHLTFPVCLAWTLGRLKLLYIHQGAINRSFADVSQASLLTVLVEEGFPKFFENGLKQGLLRRPCAFIECGSPIPNGPPT